MQLTNSIFILHEEFNRRSFSISGISPDTKICQIFNRHHLNIISRILTCMRANKVNLVLRIEKSRGLELVLKVIQLLNINISINLRFHLSRVQVKHSQEVLSVRFLVPSRSLEQRHSHSVQLRIIRKLVSRGILQHILRKIIRLTDLLPSILVFENRSSRDVESVKVTVAHHH